MPVDSKKSRSLEVSLILKRLHQNEAEAFVERHAGPQHGRCPLHTADLSPVCVWMEQDWHDADTHVERCGHLGTAPAARVESGDRNPAVRVRSSEVYRLAFWADLSYATRPGLKCSTVSSRYSESPRNPRNTLELQTEEWVSG